MDLSAAQEISEALRTKPYRLDCADSVPMHRPRFAWVSEKVEGLLTGIDFDPQAFWTTIIAQAPYPEVTQWIQPGMQWLESEPHTIFPTCMKSIPRSSPPPKPAGIERCMMLQYPDGLVMLSVSPLISIRRSSSLPPILHGVCFLQWKGKSFWAMVSDTPPFACQPLI